MKYRKIEVVLICILSIAFVCTIIAGSMKYRRIQSNLVKIRDNHALATKGVFMENKAEDQNKSSSSHEIDNTMSTFIIRMKAQEAANAKETSGGNNEVDKQEVVPQENKPEEINKN